VYVPRFSLSQAGLLYSIYLFRRNARLSWHWCWLYWDGLPVRRQSLVRVVWPLDRDLTGIRTCDLLIVSSTSYHYTAKPPLPCTIQWLDSLYVYLWRIQGEGGGRPPHWPDASWSRRKFCTKMHYFCMKISKIFWRGGISPDPIPYSSALYSKFLDPLLMYIRRWILFVNIVCVGSFIVVTRYLTFCVVSWYDFLRMIFCHYRCKWLHACNDSFLKWYIVCFKNKSQFYSAA